MPKLHSGVPDLSSIRGAHRPCLLFLQRATSMAIVGGPFVMTLFFPWINAPLIAFVKPAFDLDEVNARAARLLVVGMRHDACADNPTPVHNQGFMPQRAGLAWTAPVRPRNERNQRDERDERNQRSVSGS